MGRGGRPTACRSLDRAHRLLHGGQRWGAPPELALYPRHRARILLSEVPQPHAEGHTDRTAHLLCPRGRDDVRRGARSGGSMRTLRTAVRQRAGHAVQYGCLCLCHHRGCRLGVGHLGDDATGPEPDAGACIVPALDRTAGYPLHWRRLLARCAADCSAGCGSLPHETTPCGCTEHDARLAARHRGGLFLLRVDPHPLDG